MIDIKIDICPSPSITDPQEHEIGGRMKKVVDAGSSGEFGWHAAETALRCARLFSYKFRCKKEEGKEVCPAPDAPPPLAGPSAFQVNLPRGDADNTREPLARGSLVHAGLANHYKILQLIQQGHDPQTVREEWASPAEAVSICASTNRWTKYQDEAIRITNGYIANWMREEVEVLHVEDVFAAEVEGRRYTQRLDLVIRDRDKKVYVLDHKVVGRISPQSIDRYTLSGQFIGMRRLVEMTYGDQFGGVKLNLIEAGDKGLKFHRDLVAPAPSAVRTFPLTVLHARRIVDMCEDIPPEEWPQALSEQTCYTPYGRCDYFDRCRWGSK
jgi:hypothetical protein